jgi:enoyl-CoA hydratase/carnithine racemase
MIDSKVVDGIAVLAMTHGKVNALDIEFCDTLARHFDDLRRSDAKAVVLTGKEKIFSAGVDLKRLSAGSCQRCTGFTKRRSFTRNPLWPRSTATPLPAAACSPVAPIAASWRAMPAASASRKFW